MSNENYKNSFADRYITSKTTPAITEYVNDNLWDARSIYMPLSIAENALVSGSYDDTKIREVGFGVVKIDYKNYTSVMTGSFKDDWSVAFNDGGNVYLTLLVIIVDDTSFSPIITDKRIEWINLTKAFNACYNFSFIKTMYSTDYTGESDVNYFDMALCLAKLCNDENEFSQFVVYVKLKALDDLTTKQIGDVDKDTEHLPSGASNGDYVVATGESEDFPYTIDGIEFKAVEQKAYYNSNTSSWGDSPAIDDDELCKIQSYSSAEEQESITTLTGTTQTQRANFFWGCLLLIAPKSQFISGNTLPLLSVLTSKLYTLDRDSVNGMVGKSPASKALDYSGLKPFGKANILDSAVNNNPSNFYFSRLVSKNVYFPISTGIGLTNQCVIKENKDISAYPIGAREINKYIDYKTKIDITKWWTSQRDNVLCNEQTYETIQSFLKSNVISFVTEGLLENAEFSFTPFREAKKGNSIVAIGIWSADFVNDLGSITITGIINVELTREA